VISILCYPRSGSTYLTALLKATGLQARHETIQGPSDVVVGFPFKTIDTAGDLKTAIRVRLDMGACLWLLRDPRRTIPSAAQFFNNPHDGAFFKQQFGGDDRLTTHARGWLKTNRLLQQFGSPYLLERMDNPFSAEYNRLCSALCVEPTVELPFLNKGEHVYRKFVNPAPDLERGQIAHKLYDEVMERYHQWASL